MSRYDRFTTATTWHRQSISPGWSVRSWLKSTKRDDNTNIAEFRLQPLERGFGHTLGNAMRRMLLSSLRGSAVWGFRIDGVVHEHQTIPGVVEDVHQIIGNLKTLTLSLADDVDEAILRISKSEAGPVTAADIQDQSGVQVIDPRHHLFTLQDDRDINVELYVNKGRGYVEADQHVDRPRPADRPGSHRLDLQPRPPSELRGGGDARWPAHGLRSTRTHGRDERDDLARGSGELRRRARADALPVLRRVRLACRLRPWAVVASSRAVTRTGSRSCSARRSMTSSCPSAR